MKNIAILHLFKKSHNPIYNNSPLVEIEALKWVQGAIQAPALNNITRDWPPHDSK
jgi:hypothetical protein